MKNIENEEELRTDKNGNGEVGRKKGKGLGSLLKRNQSCFPECAFIPAFAHFVE